MEIKITNKILSIPPHISTQWQNIQSIHMDDAVLEIQLYEGTRIRIKGLNSDTIEKIFTKHAEVIDSQGEQSNMNHIIKSLNPSSLSGLDPKMFHVGFAAVDEMGSVMSHNPDQADAPDIPPEIIEKITTLIETIAPENIGEFPTPEPNCNCMHCQISKAIQEKLLPISDEEADVFDITDEDLKFEQWIIEKVGEELYRVTNKLDRDEHYNVFLGSPVGCTCGKDNCEHIIAVLKS